MDEILIVEDDASVARALARMFRSLGRKVFTAADGREALAHLSAAAPAVIVLDLWITGVDGVTLLRHVRDEPRLRLVRVVVYSGDSPAALAGLLNGLSVDACFSKDGRDFDAFVSAVDRLAGRSPLLQESCRASREACAAGCGQV